MPEEKITEKEGGEKIDAPLEKPNVAAEAPQAPVAPEQESRGEKKSERLEGKYHEILSRVLPPSSASQHSDNPILDAKSIAATVDEESKIQKLLDLAQSKGVAHAVKVARELKDYYALDRMHDALVDKLYEGLLSRGLIQKD